MNERIKDLEERVIYLEGENQNRIADLESEMDKRDNPDSMYNQ